MALSPGRSQRAISPAASSTASVSGAEGMDVGEGKRPAFCPFAAGDHLLSFDGGEQHPPERSPSQLGKHGPFLEAER